MDQLRRLSLNSDQPPAWAVRFAPDGQGTRAQQLAAQMRQAISAAALRPGDRIPPSRVLAKALRTSRGTVVTAVEQLSAEGLLETRIGSGTFVAEAAPTVMPLQAKAPKHWQRPMLEPAPAAVDQPLPGAIDFRPCRPSMAEFPIGPWRRCLNAALGLAPASDYGDPRGDPDLRSAICDYLRRARGMSIGRDELMVTNGAVHAMHLIAQVYLAVPEGEPAPVAVMEDPGYPLARQLFAGAGARLHYCGIDHDGLCVSVLPTATQSLRLAYVSASHQFPTGARLSRARRQQLLGWAAEHGVLIIEDDYDGEFCYDVEPLPPLAAMGKGQVAYCGSFSKTLFPDLRLGFVAAHAEQIELLARYRTRMDYACNGPTQRALARFIADGHYERHIHRMRRAYARKREQVATLVEASAMPFKLLGSPSGLNALISLPDVAAGTAAALSARAENAGVLIPDLSRYQFKSSVEQGLVLGYAALSTEQIDLGLERLLSLRL
ncbi:MAG: PLP-dependent aminotransferase family protein [Pseudomonadales bacterium]